MSDAEASAPARDERILSLERPDDALLLLYLVQSLGALIFAPVAFLPLYFKYRTLRYEIDEEGISVSWGILFRREIHLTYRRIQDIHVRRNIVERWLDIGTVQIQTASGSSEAEMSLVGIREHEAMRDFLYRRMRGSESEPERIAGEVVAGSGYARPGATEAGDEEIVRLLHEIRDELVAARSALEART